MAEVMVMTVKVGEEVHLSTSKIRVDNHIERPASEVTCKYCRQSLIAVGYLPKGAKYGS